MREGLRVIEEAARFKLNNEELTLRIKEIRHKYGHIKMLIPDDMILSRDSETDIGKSSNFDKSGQLDIADITARSFGRTEEAARVIEEYGGMINREISIIAKGIRFELYNLEKIIFPELKRINRITDTLGLYLVMTNPAVGYEELARIAVANEVSVIQLRDKEMNDRDLVETGRRLKKITERTNTLFIVNDRPDIAYLCNADGVHVGQDDLSVEECRNINNNFIVGKSTHNMSQLINALDEKPDYLGIGPIHPTSSKNIPDPVLGLVNAAEMLKRSNIPAIAIGGINDSNIISVLESGFLNYGIISFINTSSNPENEIKKIKLIYRRYYDTEKKSNIK